MTNESLISALNEALDMEKKGHAFYEEMSKKSTNDITKKTFSFLKDNEILHIDNIKAFYETLKRDGKVPAFNSDAFKTERRNEYTIFRERLSSLKDKIKPKDDDKKACEFAMDFENKGYKHYEKMLKRAKDANLIKLLKFLLEEEANHYESIKKTYEYLTDSANWFMFEEGSFPQG